MNQQYRENRSKIPWEELVKYQGKWVAFSMDGQRVLASHADLDGLEDQLEASGIDAQSVVLERMGAAQDGLFLGAGEFG